MFRFFYFLRLKVCTFLKQGWSKCFKPSQYCLKWELRPGGQTTTTEIRQIRKHTNRVWGMQTEALLLMFWGKVLTVLTMLWTWGFRPLAVFPSTGCPLLMGQAPERHSMKKIWSFPPKRGWRNEQPIKPLDFAGTLTYRNHTTKNITFT